MLLAAIDITADSKLTRFAIRLALSSQVRLHGENETDFLTEADAVFAPQPQPKQKAKTGSRKAYPRHPTRKGGQPRNRRQLAHRGGVVALTRNSEVYKRHRATTYKALFTVFGVHAIAIVKLCIIEKFE